MEKEEFKEARSKTTKQVVLLVIVVALVLAGFYWVFVRPPLARKNCDKKAHNFASDDGKIHTTSDLTRYDAYYKVCLHRNGL